MDLSPFIQFHKLRLIALLHLILITGCASTLNVPDSGTDFDLDGCTPLLNCVSSTSSVFLYHVEPVQLAEPLNESTWNTIKSVATGMPGASLNEARFGYLDITFYSTVFHFPDFFEVLVSQDGNTLDVRSQSLLGIFDFFANRRRVERFRDNLVEEGVSEGPESK
jgi:uncharacterized protein (DUF1499 family)